MTDPTKKAQKDMILNHMERIGPITPLEALSLYGCNRLSARIWDLRHDGFEIISETVEVETAHGGRARVARYRLAA